MKKLKEKDIYEFIEIVQRDECLWHVTSFDYYTGLIRKNKWDQIGNKFGISGEEAKNLFKSLREKYRRQKELFELYSQNGTTRKRKPWPFFKHLQFLDLWYKKRKQVKCEDDLDKIDELECSFLDNLEANKLQESNSEESVSDSSSEDDTLTSAPYKSTPCSNRSTKNSDKSFDVNIMKSLNELVTKLNNNADLLHQSRPSSVMLFLGETMDQLKPQDKKGMEEELMTIAMKYRFKIE